MTLARLATALGSAHVSCAGGGVPPSRTFRDASLSWKLEARKSSSRWNIAMSTREACATRSSRSHDRDLALDCSAPAARFRDHHHDRDPSLSDAERVRFRGGSARKFCLRLLYLFPANFYFCLNLVDQPCSGIFRAARADARSAESVDALHGHGRGRAHPHLFVRLHGSGRRQIALLRRSFALHVLDARDRARRTISS